jgi:hypothetical protein
MNKKLFFVMLVIAGLGVSCNQSTQTAKEEVSSNSDVKTNEKVQTVIDELGLVYVEEGAFEIITYNEVNAAQQAWCEALVEISRLHDSGEDYRSFAKQVINDAYNYDYGKVFFKPTLTFGPQTFRNTKEGALAYFVGGDENYPDDSGFALKSWVKARYDNAGDGNEGIQIYGSTAITMGNVWVTDKDGNEVMVDKTWVFKKGKDGKLRIIVHKSSLPFSPSAN